MTETVYYDKYHGIIDRDVVNCKYKDKDGNCTIGGNSSFCDGDPYNVCSFPDIWVEDIPFIDSLSDELYKDLMSEPITVMFRSSHRYGDCICTLNGFSAPSCNPEDAIPNGRLITGMYGQYRKDIEDREMKERLRAMGIIK